MCSGAKWKREAVPEHKFTNVDVNVFYENSFIRKIQYSFVFLMLIKAFIMSTVDIWTAVLLILKGGIGEVVPYGRWIFLSSVCMSFILFGLEWFKSRRIIRSQDIAYAFTNVTAYRTYCVKSYSHFCFFSQVNNSTTFKDSFAFWIFFRLKGYKRLLLAEAPRQVISLLTIIDKLKIGTKLDSIRKVNLNVVLRINKSDFVESMAFNLMMFSFIVFAISLLILAVAFAFYLPFLCVIKGNLKEYVCHLVDKRIAGLLVKKSQKRIDDVKKVAKRLNRAEIDSQQQFTAPSMAHSISGPEPIGTRQTYEKTRPSTDSVGSYMTSNSAYSHRPLISEKPPMPALPTNYPPYHGDAPPFNANNNLPMAMRTNQPAAPAVPRAFLASPSETGDAPGQSTFVKVRGFGGKVPYRAPSRRDPPKSIVGEPVPESEPTPVPQFTSQQHPYERDGYSRTDRSVELDHAPPQPPPSRFNPGVADSMYSEYEPINYSNNQPHNPYAYPSSRTGAFNERPPNPPYRNIISYADSEASSDYVAPPTYGRVGQNNFNSGGYGGSGAGQRF